MSFAAISMRTLSCSSLSPFSDVFLFRHICPDFLIRISNFPVRKHIEGFPNDNDTQTLFDYLLPGHYQPGLKNTLTLKLMRDLIRNRLISVLREQKSHCLLSLHFINV